jgi:hypothetical protein
VEKQQIKERKWRNDKYRKESGETTNIGEEAGKPKNRIGSKETSI